MAVSLQSHVPFDTPAVERPRDRPSGGVVEEIRALSLETRSARDHVAARRAGPFHLLGQSVRGSKPQFPHL